MAQFQTLLCGIQVMLESLINKVIDENDPLPRNTVHHSLKNISALMNLAAAEVQSNAGCLAIKNAASVQYVDNTIAISINTAFFSCSSIHNQ